jgi:hypothetical protein
LYKSMNAAAAVGSIHVSSFCWGAMQEHQAVKQDKTRHLASDLGALLFDLSRRAGRSACPPASQPAGPCSVLLTATTCRAAAAPDEELF